MSSLRTRRKNIDLIWGADELDRIDGIAEAEATRDQAAIGSRNLLCALAEYFLKYRALTKIEKAHWIGVINE